MWFGFWLSDSGRGFDSGCLILVVVVVLILIVVRILVVVWILVEF